MPGHMVLQYLNQEVVFSCFGKSNTIHCYERTQKIVKIVAVNGTSLPSSRYLVYNDVTLAGSVSMADQQTTGESE